MDASTPTANKNVFEWLKTFKIEVESATPNLYGNGQQQVHVLLTVEPRQGQVITPEQLNSLTIVMPQGDGTYKPLPLAPGPEKWWMSDRKNAFEHYNPEIKKSSTAPQEAKQEKADQDLQYTIDHCAFTNSKGRTVQRLVVQITPQDAKRSKAAKRKAKADQGVLYTIDRYVVTTSVGGTGQRLRAQITQNADNTFVTESGPEGEIRLFSMSLPPVYVPDSYSFSRTLISGSDASGAVVYEYRLKPINYKFVDDVDDVIATLDPAGMIVWHDKAPSETFASHVGYVRPGQTDVIYNANIQLSDDFKNNRMVKTVSRRSDDALTIVLQADRNIPYHSDSANNQGGPCVIRAYDQNGTLHELRLAFPVKSDSAEGDADTDAIDRFNLELSR